MTWNKYTQKCKGKAFREERANIKIHSITVLNISVIIGTCAYNLKEPLPGLLNTC